MTDGFLGRWSRRKLDVKEGKEVPPEPAADPDVAPEPAVAAAPDAPPDTIKPPPPTLDDVHALTAESDFSRFAASDVAPEVKNAAMKKLFSDPRYNIQDGLDTYIGDYSQPDPIPHAMLRKLASAKFLGLFDAEEKAEAEAEAAAKAGEAADTEPAPTVAGAGPALPAEPAAPANSDDADRVARS